MNTIPRLFIFLAIVVSVLAASCGGDDNGTTTNGNGTPSDGTPTEQQLFPAPGNSELVVGPNRFAFALNDENGDPFLNEDVLVRLFYGEEMKVEEGAGFTWAIQDVVGFYVLDVDFDTPGQWTSEVTLTLDDGTEKIVTFTFNVIEDSAFPNVGDPAPPSDSPTLATQPNILQLSTDPEPNDAFYQVSIADAVTSGQPSVIVFATPAFCTTQFCGPVLDNVKEVSESFADVVTFVHVEPFELDEEGGLVAAEGGGTIPVPTVLEWGLQTEPWVYIVDANGTVSKRFEGTASTEELTAAIEDVVT